MKRLNDVDFEMSELNGKSNTVLGNLLTLCLLLVILPAAAYSQCQITLAWDSNPDPSIAFYTVHWGTESGIYTNSVNVGLVTNTIVTGLTCGTLYFFFVTDSYANGLESLPSNEVSAFANQPAPALFPPSSSMSLNSATIQMSGATMQISQ